MSAFDPVLRTQIARMGAHALHARRSVSETTQAGLEAIKCAREARLVSEYGLDRDAPDFAVRLAHAVKTDNLKRGRELTKKRQQKARRVVRA